MVRLHRQRQHLSGCCFCFTAYHSDQPLVTITTGKRCKSVNLKEKVMEFYKSTAGCGYNEYAIVTPTGNKDEYLCVWTNEDSLYPIYKEGEIVKDLDSMYLEPFDANENHAHYQSTAFTFFKQVKTLQSEKAELVEILREFIDPLTGLVYGHIECAIGKEKAFKIEQLLTKYKRL